MVSKEENRMGIPEVMFELSHAGRIKILKFLKEKPLRMSDISKKLKVTTAEASRQLERLVKTRLIEKGVNTNYYLTNFGEIIFSEMDTFGFLIENVDFFTSHDLSAIPEELKCFASISMGNMSKGTLHNISFVQELSMEAAKYVNIIADQPLGTAVELNCKKIDEGVKFRIIYPESAVIPDEYKTRLGDNLQIRLLKNLRLSLKMNEKRGGFAISNLRGKVDYETVVEGTDKRFHRWCLEVFEVFWKQGRPFLKE